MSCSAIDIGKRVAKLREGRGLSQGELAAELHVSREVVAKWENGTRDLKTQYTISLADYFDITCDELLRGIKSENINTHEVTGLSDDAIDTLRRLPLLGESVSDFIVSVNFHKLLFVMAKLERMFFVYGDISAKSENDAKEQIKAENAMLASVNKIVNDFGYSELLKDFLSIPSDIMFGYEHAASEVARDLIKEIAAVRVIRLQEASNAQED
ncbi:MAG: helix-turn-helix transcriptional regulator [Oscillospiraceae bacterium]|nr:helix-turn-helix transcriptional regulator [Oscillospiraceae bacterium]